MYEGVSREASTRWKDLPQMWLPSPITRVPIHNKETRAGTSIHLFPLAFWLKDAGHQPFPLLSPRLPATLRCTLKLWAETSLPSRGCFCHTVPGAPSEGDTFTCLRNLCWGCQLHRRAYCRAQRSRRRTHGKGLGKSTSTQGTCCFSGYLRAWTRKPKLTGTLFLIYSSRIYLLTLQSGAPGICPSRQLPNPTVVSHQCKSFANVIFLKTR